MPFTDEFRRILKKNKRNGIDSAFEKAMNEAVDLGVKPYRDRKKRQEKFKRQKGATDFGFTGVI